MPHGYSGGKGNTFCPPAGTEARSCRPVSITATQGKISVVHLPSNCFLLGLLSLYFVTSTHFFRINPAKPEQ